VKRLVEEGLTGRDVRRLETRERVFQAAITEFKRSGVAAADIAAIVRAAGVAWGTFYFHFPTKEHALAELERREDARIAAELERFLAGPHDAASMLAEVVRLVLTVEQRLERVLFREMLALQFSPVRPGVQPAPSDWSAYPVIRRMVEEIEGARDRGEVHPETNPVRAVLFFLLGLYALLITSYDQSATDRADLVDDFVAMAVRDLERR
jgi:TetR/AcrR family transcriptional repressor of uid operon